VVELGQRVVSGLEAEFRRDVDNNADDRAIMFHIGIATQAPPLPEMGELSELGIDFVDRCLTLDPSVRPTATQLRGHEWVQRMESELVRPT